MESVQTESVQTEVAGSIAMLAKCAHPDCICTVTTGERFCSDYCMEQAGASEAAADDACNCGHPECMHAGAKMALPPAALPA